jgi:hypothetical protein
MGDHIVEILGSKKTHCGSPMIVDKSPGPVLLDVSSGGPGSDGHSDAKTMPGSSISGTSYYSKIKR